MSSQSILQVMWHVCVVKYFSTQLLFPDVFSVTVHLCCFCSAVPLLQSGLISTPANTWYMHILLVHLHMNLNSASVSWTVRVLICSPHERQKIDPRSALLQQLQLTLISPPIYHNLMSVSSQLIKILMV